MFTIPGLPVSRAADVPVTRFAAVDARYLQTMGFALRRGRYFPNQDPIGRQIHPGPPPGIPAGRLESFGWSSRNITIVGVVRNFMNRGMALPPGPQIFTLFRQLPELNFGF